MDDSKLISTFAAPNEGKGTESRFECTLIIGFLQRQVIDILQVSLGLTGFDSKLRWYVSMQSDGCKLFKNSVKKLIGNNEYALAA